MGAVQCSGNDITGDIDNERNFCISIVCTITYSYSVLTSHSGATQKELTTNPRILNYDLVTSSCPFTDFHTIPVAAEAEWYKYRIVACLVTSSSPVPLKTRRVEQRCTLNLSRAERSSRGCGVVVRRRGASSVVVHVT
ncbi:uncharacterized protein TNCV_1372491 [Trichonephila clavipes]|nr:uncharacterized protein TNCV_1372491 [Trichonephila clavipes]